MDRLLLAVLIAVVPSRIAAAPVCRPAVLLVGDPVVTATISAALEGHGIVAPSEGCPFSRAEVVQRGDGLVLAIVDYEGRRSQRRVGDATVAVSVIESFAMTSGNATWTTTAPPPIARDAEEPSALTLRAEPTQARGAIGAALESSASTDGSIWFGARARGCVQLGRTCIGGELRIAHDAELRGAGAQTLSTRTAADLLVVLEVPLPLHRMVLAPGIGVGVGWMRVRSDADAAAFPMGGESLDVDAGGVRANVHVGLSVPLRSGIAVTLGASLDVAPFAHTARYVMDGGELAGEPRGYARLALGVEMVR